MTLTVGAGGAVTVPSADASRMTSLSDWVVRTQPSGAGTVITGSPGFLFASTVSPGYGPQSVSAPSPAVPVSAASSPDPAPRRSHVGEVVGPDHGGIEEAEGGTAGCPGGALVVHSGRQDNGRSVGDVAGGDRRVLWICSGFA